MLTRTLGKSKLEVSALGMGCWAIGGPWTWDQPGQTPYPVGWGNTDDEESIRALQTAMDHGCQFLRYRRELRGRSQRSPVRDAPSKANATRL